MARGPMGRSRGPVEKPKNFGGVMSKLAKFCRHYIPVMIFALILGAAGIANMWLAIFADVGVMVLAVLNAVRALFVKKL